MSILEPEWPQAATELPAAAALKQQRMAGLMDGVGRCARTKPVAFFGGTVLAGVVLTCFLKSATERHPIRGRS